MAIAYEGNTDLAFDTGVLKKAAREYKKVAEDLRDMASKLDSLLLELKEEGWTTPAGTAFYKMTDTNWKQNIGKYAALLDSLDNILNKAASEYENLITEHVRETRVKEV